MLSVISSSILSKKTLLSENPCNLRLSQRSVDAATRCPLQFRRTYLTGVAPADGTGVGSENPTGVICGSQTRQTKQTK